MDFGLKKTKQNKTKTGDLKGCHFGLSADLKNL